MSLTRRLGHRCLAAYLFFALNLIILLPYFVGEARAQDTNALEMLNQALGSKGKFPTENPKCFNHCEGVQSGSPPVCILRSGERREVRTTDLQIYSLRGKGCECSKVCHQKTATLTAIEEPSMLIENINYSKPIYTSVPSNTNIQQIVYENCSTIQQSLTAQLTIAYAENEQFTWTKTVSKSKTTGFNIGVKLSWMGADLNLGMNHSVQSQLSTATGYTKQLNTTTTKSASIPVLVPPKSKVITEGLIAEMPAVVNLTATAILDAPLSKNVSGLAVASQLLPIEERRINIAGQLTVTKATEIRAKTVESKLDAAYCAGRSGIRTSERSFSVVSFDDPAAVTDFIAEFSNRSRRRSTASTQQDDPALPGGFCSATNPNTGVTCSIQCAQGEAAYCDPNNGGDYPSCGCL